MFQGLTPLQSAYILTKFEEVLNEKDNKIKELEEYKTILAIYKEFIGG